MFVIYFFASVVDAYFWLRLTGYYLTERFKMKIIYCFTLLLLTPFFVKLTMYEIFSKMISNEVYSLMTILLVVILTLFVYINRKVECILYVILFRVIILSFDIITSTVYSIFANSGRFGRAPYGVVLIITRVLLIFMIVFLKVRRPKQPDLQRNDISCIAGIMFLGYMLMEYVNYSIDHRKMLMSSSYGSIGTVYFMCIVAFFICVLVYLSILKKSAEDVEERLRIQQLELESLWKKDVEAETKKLRMLRHDMNNHITVLKVLADTDQMDDLKEYINEMSGKVEKANDVVVSKNTTLASLISQKKSKAKEFGIKLSSSIAINEFNISDMDVATIFGNLLDNAIEAAASANDKWIDLKIEEKPDKYCIECENSYLKDPKIRQNTFVTSKDDADSHGMGITSMKKAIQKYKGESDFSFRDKVFCVKISLPVIK